MQDCEIQPKTWVTYGLWGVCPSAYKSEMFATYCRLSNTLPPITAPKLIDLATVNSVTACLGGGDVITQDGNTYTPFYRDQQDCVIWYEGADKKIYFPSWADTKMTLCADSMEEFTSRIAMETTLWHKLNKVREAEKGDYLATTIQKDPILKHWKEFNFEEQAYITYFFENCK